MDKVDRITLMRRSCRYEETERLIRELLPPLREAPAAHVELGRIALQRGRHSVGLSHIERALDIDPRFEPALAWRVAALSRLRRYDEAFENAHLALQEDPHRPLVRVALARIWEDKGADYQLELSELQRVLTADPMSLKALEWRIYALGDLGRFQEAEQASKEARAVHPNAAELCTAFGIVLSIQGRYREAIEEAERSLCLHSEYVLAMRFLISHLISAKMYKEAIARAKVFAETLPWAGELHLAWGKALYYIDDTTAALEKFVIACELEPDDYEPCIWRVATLRRLKRYVDAQKELSNALVRIPDSPAHAAASMGSARIGQQ